MNLDCCFTHQSAADFLNPEALGKKTVIIIDVLRATSSITTALNNGAVEVLAVKSIEDALRLKKALPEALLVGERNGDIIPGFELGNSPLEFSREKVLNKKIIFCTTNGTAAIELAAGAGAKPWIGAIINAPAVAEKAAAEEVSDLLLLCAGTNGKISLDDILGAGSIIRHILDTGQRPKLSDAALISLKLYNFYRENLLEGLQTAFHGNKLKICGRGEDLIYCSKEGLIPRVPVFNKGRIII